MSEPADLACGHSRIWDRPEGCLKCRAMESLGQAKIGLSSLEALILAKRNGLRVTFGKDVVIERPGMSLGASSGHGWLEVARAETFLKAMIDAVSRLGLK